MKPNHAEAGPPSRHGLASLLWRFVAWFLEGLYTHWAWGYDLVANLTSMGQWWHWQQAVIPGLTAGRLLELGFGTGRLMRDLLATGHHLYGLDRSRQMNRLTQARLHRAGLPDRLVRGDALQLPFAKHSFDCIFATFPSDYFYKAQALSEMWRALKPDGKLIVVPFAVITGQTPWDRLARLLYQMTGQSPAKIETAWLAKVNIPGFKLSYQRVVQPRAEILQVTLEKVTE